MSAVETVGVREFRDHATQYLSGSVPVAVSKHGRIIGFYLPVQRSTDEVRDALSRLGDVVEQVLQSSGLSEDELVAAVEKRRERSTETLRATLQHADQ